MNNQPVKESILLENKKETREVVWLNSGRNPHVPRLGFIKVDEKYCISVDGFMLFVIPTPQFLMKYVGKLIKLGKINSLSSAVAVEVGDDKFPDYPQVVPTEKPAMEITLSAKLLRQITADYQGAVKFRIYDPLKPIELSMIDEVNGKKRYVILMPMHSPKDERDKFYAPLKS